MRSVSTGLKRIGIGLAALLLLACLLLVAMLRSPLPRPPGPFASGPLLLDDVHILDVETGRIRYRQAVWIDDGRISRIADAPPRTGAQAQPGPLGMARLADGRLRIDARGRFLLPGLADMHTHSLQVSPQLHHPLWIAAGVTTVRDLSGCMLEPDSYHACTADRQRWQRELQAGRATAPNYRQHGSYALNGGAEVPPHYPPFFQLRSPADAKAVAEHYRKQGTDFLKVYEQLGAQQYRWLAAAAREAGLGIAGHQPWLVPYGDMLAAGQRSVEHGRVFLYACADAATALRQGPLPRSLSAEQWRAILRSQNPAACGERMREMAAAGTWWSPTLLTLQLGARADEPAFRQDDRLAYVPQVLRWLWQGDADRMARIARDTDGVNVHAGMLALAQSQVKAAHAAGVGILAGTDTPDSYVFAGSGLHDELALYVRAGLTPLQALQTATINPAVFAGIADRTGSVAVGKTADLLLVGRNPLLDLPALRRPDAVIVAGHLYPRSVLQALERFSREQAASLKLNLHLAWDMAASPPMRRQFAD